MSNTQLNAMDLLDKSIDDIEDLPGFEVPPPGTYALKYTAAIKPINDKAFIENTFEVLEALELNDPTIEGVKIGTKFSTLTQIGNDIAMGKYKEFVAPLAAHFDEKNLGKLVSEHLKDVVITGTVKHRKNKEDESKPYGEVSNVVVS